MKLWLMFALVAAILFGIVSCEVSIWQECRADHSWFYCMRVLNK
jgi:hypothetical protein